MSFPEDMIVNWIKHPIVNGICTVCGVSVPSVSIRDGVSYSKQGRWLMGAPKKSEDCTG